MNFAGRPGRPGLPLDKPTNRIKEFSKMGDQQKVRNTGDQNRSGRPTRRRVIEGAVAGGGAVLGAALLSPMPLRFALAQSKPYRIGTMQPLSGAAAIIGKTALVGVQMAADRINKAGGINGRPVELIVADYESKPDVGRRKAEKLAVEDMVDAHVGGVLSNVCLACMPVWEEQ